MSEDQETMYDDEDILPCPFCGGKPTVFSEDVPYANGAPDYGFTFKKSHHLQCDCGAGGFVFNGDGSLDKCITAWNKRDVAKEDNSPIEKLLQEYTEECCDFTDMDWVIKVSRAYADRMPDSQVRCLMHTMAYHLKKSDED